MRPRARERRERTVPIGTVERDGDLLVGEVGPGQQEQRLALVAPEAPQGLQHVGLQGLGPGAAYAGRRRPAAAGPRASAAPCASGGA